MAKQIIIALATEGSTDLKLLSSIIKRTFDKIAFAECRQEIEIFDPVNLKQMHGDIQNKAINYAKEAVNNGANILCFHADADDPTDDRAFRQRIDPAFKAIQEDEQDLCKNLVAIVPVRMTEAWMLADKDLLKSELGTTKDDSELGINKSPESFANPKKIIEEAIKKARAGKHRRRKLPIEQLYIPIGQRIELEKLELLPSYVKFRKAVQDVFKELNY